MSKKFSKISSIIQDAKKGKMFILVDDKNRENEGDLIIPGSKCNSKNINFINKETIFIRYKTILENCNICMKSRASMK